MNGSQEWVSVRVHVLIGVTTNGTSRADGPEFNTHDPPGIIHFEGQSLAEMQVRIVRGRLGCPGR